MLTFNSLINIAAIKFQGVKIVSDDNKENILYKLILFFPLQIGKLFLKLCWRAITKEEFELRRKTNEYSKTCIAGFIFFLIFHIYFIFLYIFVKLNIYNPTFFKILYFHFTAILFSVCLNFVIFVLARYLINKINIKNIKKRLEKNEEIIYQLQPIRTGSMLMVLLFSYLISTGLIQIFADIHTIPISYTIACIFVIYLFFPQVMIVYSNTSVLTNKRIIVEKFFKILTPIYLSFDSAKKAIECNKDNIDYIGTNFIKDDIYLNQITNIEDKTRLKIENITIEIDNGAKMSFKTDNDYEIKKTLLKLTNKEKI